MIRPAVVGDAVALAEIHIRAWQVAYEDDFPEPFLSSLDVERRTAWFDQQIRSGAEILVAQGPGSDVVTGFCFFGSSTDHGWGEIFAVYVDPVYWGSGLGYRLFGAAIRSLTDSGHTRMLLWVLQTNERARSFYERQGMALGKPVRIEEIGGVQVMEVRYEINLPGRA
jgi:ribosomal protein S18 acetylase RimI-like enzyme